MDFPGVGTKDFPKEEYMKKTNLLESGVVVIVSATRFTDNDMWIAKEVIKVRKNVLFVRTKIDIDLYNAKEDDPDEFSEYTCITTIRKEIERRMNQEDIHNLREVIFLVSSRNRTKYDFVSLVSIIKCLLNMKGRAICSLLYVHMIKTIESKTKRYETEFIGRKVPSVITGILPIPKLESTVDNYHVRKIAETCRGYCIDIDSLKQIASVIGESVEDLQSKLKSYEEDISDGGRLHTETEDRKFLFVEKYSKYIVPGLGMLYSASKSPRTMQECLNKICRVMAEDEMKLVKFRLRKLGQDLIE